MSAILVLINVSNFDDAKAMASDLVGQAGTFEQKLTVSNFTY